MGQLITIENRAGSTLHLDAAKLIPVERVVRLQTPGMRGFLFWRRPSQILVEHPDGAEEILKVSDTTRQAQIAILGFALIGSILIWLFNRNYSA